jgi:DnaJ-class molecular chaperone
MGRDNYEALGVPSGANQSEIRAAYRRKAKELHPDAGEGGDQAAFCEVQSAYDTLRDPQARLQYDRHRTATQRRSETRAWEATRGYRRGGFAVRSERSVGTPSDIFDRFFTQAFRVPLFGTPTTAEFDLSLSPAEAERGATLRLALDPSQTVIVSVPPGVADGQVLRLVVEGWFGRREIVVYVAVG